MATLPARNILDGTSVPTTSIMKNTLGTLRDYLSGLFGDSGNIASTRAVLGVAPMATRQEISSAAAPNITIPTECDDFYISSSPTAITSFTISVGRVIRISLSGAYLTISAGIISNGIYPTGLDNSTASKGVGHLVLRATAANTVEVISFIPGSGVARAGVNSDITDLTTVTSANIGTINTLSSINGGPLGGFRNRIINGKLNVTNRAYQIVTGTGFCIADRFKINLNMGSAANAVDNYISIGSTVYKALAHSVVAVPTFSGAGAEWHGICQYIEGLNCYDLANQPISVSFIFLASGVSGIYSVALRDTFGKSYVTTFAATSGTPTRVSVNIPAGSLSIDNYKSLGLILNIGALSGTTYKTSTLNTWQTGGYFSATTATNWAITNGNSIIVTELQLEAGTVSSSFEHRHISLEESMCKRYFETGTFNWSMYQLTGNKYGSIQPFITTKRINPTMSTSGLTVTNTTVAYLSADTNGFKNEGTATSSGTVVYSGTYFADCEL